MYSTFAGTLNDSRKWVLTRFLSQALRCVSNTSNKGIEQRKSLIERKHNHLTLDSWYVEVSKSYADFYAKIREAHLKPKTTAVVPVEKVTLISWIGQLMKELLPKMNNIYASLLPVIPSKWIPKRMQLIAQVYKGQTNDSRTNLWYSDIAQSYGQFYRNVKCNIGNPIISKAFIEKSATNEENLKAIHADYNSIVCRSPNNEHVFSYIQTGPYEINDKIDDTPVVLDIHDLVDEMPTPHFCVTEILPATCGKLPEEFIEKDYGVQSISPNYIEQWRLENINYIDKEAERYSELLEKGFTVDLEMKELGTTNKDDIIKSYTKPTEST